MTESVLLVTVVRQEPDNEPREIIFEVPFGERTTVLDALNWIKDQLEPSLAFRWACRMGVCGSCGVMVNGRPMLGCETHVAGYATSGLKVEPLAHAAVERDLVVDTEAFIAKMRSIAPWMVSEPAVAEPVETSGSPDVLASSSNLNINTQTPEQLLAIHGLSQCINCLLCYAACPALDDVPGFTGPAAIATARRWDLDSRDDGNAQRFAALAENEEGLWPCVQVGACTRACPKGVDPARAIKDYQREAMGG